MMNIIRADIYRILRGKAIYITFAVLLAFNIIVIATAQPGGFAIDVGSEQQPFSNNDPENFIFDGLHIVNVLYNGADNLAYILIPLFILVAAPMFSHGTVKNYLAGGTSRTKLYFMKLALSSALSFLMVLFYMSSGILIATILRGYGGAPPDGYWLDFIKICSGQFFMILALNCVGTFLVFTTKRTAIVNGAYLAFCIIPTTIVMLLLTVNPDFGKLYDFDLLGNISKFGYMEVMETADFIKAFATGAFYIIASTLAGILLFKRAEIK